MKKIYTFSIALIVLLLMAASASAASIRTYENGKSGYADWSSMNEYGGLYSAISVYEDSNYGTDIYVSIYGYDANGVYRDLFGWTEIKSDVFNIDNKKLSSASLSEISVPAGEYVYDPVLGDYIYKSTTLTIKADWTGVDLVTKGKSTTRNHEYTFTSTGASRNAIATGSIIEDGNDLLGGATSSYGQLSNFKTVTVTKSWV